MRPDAATILAPALALAYSAGLNIYATIAAVGLADRFDWIPPLPGSLAALASPWVIAIAAALYAVEFVATLIPGLASLWDSFHTFVRPPAAAALAVLAAWSADPVIVTLAGLLGGGLAVATHATKLGLRYAVDSSPEPVTNGVANVAELGVVASLVVAVWHHPWLTLAAALTLLVLLVLLVRRMWRALRRVGSRLRALGARL
ncbi:MAG TPA: DUF4126 domain-containing protein [Gemmatimonadaceae bacterium]|nr:DUF4126 domain-containing protein [Gemmatimonadaceae bacterium]